MSFLVTPLSLSGIDDANHPLGAGMDVDVPNLHRLLVAPPVPVKGLDHVELKPKQLEGVVAVYADIDLIEVMLALAQEFVPGKPYRRDFDREQSFQLGLEASSRPPTL